MRRFLLALFIFTSTATYAIAQAVGEGGVGVVRALNGDGLMVKVPKGWILDNRAMQRQGIDMLFYPAAYLFKGIGRDTPVFAYVMPTAKGTPYVSVQGLIDMRKEQIQRADNTATAVTEQAATLADNKVSTITIVRYSTPSLPRFERVAYLEDDRTIYAVILSAISVEELERQSFFITDLINNHRRLLADFKPNQDMAAVLLDGNTVASDGLRVAVLKNMLKTSSSRLSCASIERLNVKPMYFTGSQLRSRPEYVKDDAYEVWETTQCGKKQSYMIKFGFGPDDKTDFWINSMSSGMRP